MSPKYEWPKLGSVWQHYNGIVYRVIMHTNIEEEREDKYPRTVVYRNIANEKIYSRRLVDWERSMTEIGVYKKS